MNENRSIVPVYPTLPFSALLTRGSTKWKNWFPFSSSTGVWAFSGRVALYLGLPCLKLPPKSTILFPSYFQGVEIDTLLTAEHRLRFYRVGKNFDIDLSDVEEKLEDDVSALYVIHYFGFPQRIVPIMEFCKVNGLKLIEDCALSLFSRDEKTWLGSYGDLALFSVYKTVPVPHGGFLVMKEGKPSEKLRHAPLMSTLIQTKDLMHQNLKASTRFRLDEKITWVTGLIQRSLGWNRKQTISSGGARWDPRLLEFDASFWAVHLMRLTDPEFVISTRRQNFQYLASRLQEKIETPFADLRDGICPLFLPVTVTDKLLYQKELANLGIETVNLWYESHPACPQKLAKEVSGWRNHLLELPIHQGLSLNDMDRIADTFLDICRKKGV